MVPVSIKNIMTEVRIGVLSVSLTTEEKNQNHFQKARVTNMEHFLTMLEETPSLVCVKGQWQAKNITENIQFQINAYWGSISYLDITNISSKNDKLSFSWKYLCWNKQIWYLGFYVLKRNKQDYECEKNRTPQHVWYKMYGLMRHGNTH